MDPSARYPNYAICNAYKSLIEQRIASTGTKVKLNTAIKDKLLAKLAKTLQEINIHPGSPDITSHLLTPQLTTFNFNASDFLIKINETK